MNTFHNQLIAHYKFEDAADIGKDSSGNGHVGGAAGEKIPDISELNGRWAVTFTGGSNGTSYLELPSNLLQNVSDNTGVTVASWVHLGKGSNVWERIFDFGKGEKGPYLFLTRQMRGTLYAGDDLVVDPGRGFASGEWMHVALSVAGSQGGTRSSAGPVVYVNGEKVADGSISQTSSGNYAKLRRWFDSFVDPANYSRNYIGRSQYAADVDFAGSLSDFRIYQAALSMDEVIEVMCESLTDEEIVKLAGDKYLSAPARIITKDVSLPVDLLGGKVNVQWKSSQPEVLSANGQVQPLSSAQEIRLNALLTKGGNTLNKSFDVSVVPEHLPPYTVTIHGDQHVADISEVMYGLFYEDINNAADGGIYAELVQNRSFESFAFDTYSHDSGECGCSTGRNRDPLFAWSGDTEKMIVQHTDGINTHLNVEDLEVNAYYVTVQTGATIRNRGFSDSNEHCAMSIKKGEAYDFTVWAKAVSAGTITVQLQDGNGDAISDSVTLQVEGGNTWKKYGIAYSDTRVLVANGEISGHATGSHVLTHSSSPHITHSNVTLTGTETALGQLALTFEGDISIDMVSLTPQDVWGADPKEQGVSASAHTNYTGNPNYRLRKDLVQALVDLHPKFLRFPGGCISEGSFIWDNVYDWKDSVGAVELRKENYNVWGYMMTMGLGYMEYFQLAEDLNAAPVPVMACGVLCQARSDYAHPAGGALRDYYIRNFTDLIDFALSTDIEHNEWAAIRSSMGHPEPFDLRYLGVGNENWGTEFFANFEVFKTSIDEYMKRNYPDHELYIISTVGAQADDDAYQQGWKFLSGNLTGSAQVAFADGREVIEETVTWYENQDNYMDTIADEHYYRSNDYLLNNVDRYNYYERAYHEDGSMDWKETSKVFVGEYASTDKNTLAGAIAEAAVMTGFENNADVVRLAAYAPLFNKVLTDGTYRWTPDCIWFDDETVWYTPNYYVQQLFAKYVGEQVLETSFSTYSKGQPMELIPRGGIEIATGDADIVVKRITVTSNQDGSVLFTEDFRGRTALNEAWNSIPGSAGYTLEKGKGLILKAQSSGLNGLYLLNDEWSNYKVEVEAQRIAGEDGFTIGVGLTDISPEKKDVIEYAIGYGGNATGVKVYKQGVEGYTLGDYSSSSAAGNLRAANYEPLENDTNYTITVNYGGETGKNLICSYTDGHTTSRILDYKLEAYNRDVFHSVTRDEQHVYVKLVNADGVDKATQIHLQDLNVTSVAKWITLGGDEALLHVPNVNQKNDEKIVPQEQVIHLQEDSVVLQLPAHSVNVLVMDVQK
ncbi:alpha-L-arabinofuranosidase C-terminal domain-containing protein [Paenibacillus sp. 276b]|uniref:alpha-L-arabinofuranosidase C-terminal domain-containing protein n=1 Tax=Paenibacillus sp. 276b TaxID=1566277 RepID=UPI00089657B9|nr:alpha-L-arabinofuranosidase C-terminal domain-containing protein [Paenibacillus sp. 276b]SEA44139.1 Carbohydrate binding domain-containing protein [Paenibacillus sp. 276b]